VSRRCSPLPAAFVADALEEVGGKGAAGAILIPSGSPRRASRRCRTVGGDRPQARRPDPRAEHLRLLLHAGESCATFCTPYHVKGSVRALVAERWHRMAILGFSRTTKMGVSSIVGVGNKRYHEDDLLPFLRQDDNTQ